MISLSYYSAGGGDDLNYRNPEMLYYMIRFFIILIILLPFYLLFRKPWKRNSKKEVKREYALCVFVLFTLGLLVLALEGEYQNPALMVQSARERLRSGYAVNLVPFYSIRGFFRHFQVSVFMVNIVGNIVMFIPWGFGLPLLWKKRRSVFSAVLFSAMLPLFIESTQLFIGRSVDVDDLILNFAGGMIGAACCFLFRKKVPCIDTLAR